MPHFPHQVLEVFPKHPHMLFATDQTVPRYKNVEIQLLDPLERFDLLFRIGIAHPAISHGFYRNEIHGEEHPFSR